MRTSELMRTGAAAAVLLLSTAVAGCGAEEPTTDKIQTAESAQELAGLPAPRSTGPIYGNPTTHRRTGPSRPTAIAA